MPRGVRKRALLNPLRSQLLFVEPPRTGARHEYGPQLRSAISPRTAAPRRDAPHAAACWVSPQFSVFEAAEVRRRGRKRNPRSVNTLSATSLSTLCHVKTATASKFPALSFKTSVSSPPRLKRPASGDPHQARREDTAASPRRGPTQRSTAILKTPTGVAVRNRTTAGTSNCIYTPDVSTELTPPNIETPEMPRCDSSPSSSTFSLLFSPRTPPRTKHLLAKDTPERDYGLKVTWRRRKELMELLTGRGQLLASEAMILS